MGILFSIPEANVLCADIGVETIMTDNMGVICQVGPCGFSCPLYYYPKQQSDVGTTLASGWTLYVGMTSALCWFLEM